MSDEDERVGAHRREATQKGRTVLCVKVHALCFLWDLSFFSALLFDLTVECDHERCNLG